MKYDSQKVDPDLCVCVFVNGTGDTGQILEKRINMVKNNLF